MFILYLCNIENAKNISNLLTITYMVIKFAMMIAIFFIVTVYQLAASWKTKSCMTQIVKVNINDYIIHSDNLQCSTLIYMKHLNLQMFTPVACTLPHWTVCCSRLEPLRFHNLRNTFKWFYSGKRLIFQPRYFKHN